MALTSKTIAVVAAPGAQLLDVSGPLDVFAEANAQAGRPVYRLLLIATEPGPLATSSGVRLVPDYSIGGRMEESIHTLLVAGTPKAGDIDLSLAVKSWLKAKAPTARRYGSVCSGAFLLAQCGLLDGRRVTTHWAVAQELAARYPKVQVDEDALYVRDGRVRTAAGVTAGLDMALALVEEDLGREIALAVSRQLVMFFKRPGGQLQFSRNGTAEVSGRSALQEVQRWVAANLAEDHSVNSLAKRVQLSPRHFARLFQSEVGTTPARWVEMTRVAAARQLLEDAANVPKQVAEQCGFVNVDVLRLAFVRHVGVTPAQYRRAHVVYA